MMADESPDARLVLAPDGTVRFWNQAVAALFGYPEAEAVGRSIDELLVPEHLRAEAAAKRAEVLFRGELQFETDRKRKDGALVRIEVAYRLVSSDGEPPVIAVQHKDITARPEQFARLHAGLLDAAPDAMVVVDQSGRIVLVNTLAAKMFGYSRLELLHQCIDVILPTRFRDAHRTHRERFLQRPTTRSMGAGGPLFALRKDGTELEVEVSLAPIETDAGPMVSTAIRDVTERKKAVALAERQRFQALVEHSADGIALSSATGFILYASPAAAKIFGREAADLIGTNFRDHTHPDDLDLAREHRRRVVAGEQPGPILRRIVRPDGSIRWVDIVGTNLLDSPDVGAIVVNMRDVTDRKALDDALAISQQRFAALSESGVLGIVIGDPSGPVVEANDTFLNMLGYTRDDLPTLNRRTASPPEWDAWSVETDELIKRYGRAQPREKEYFRKDGTRVPALVGVAAVDKGKHWLAVTIDLTERNKANEAIAALDAQLRHAQKMEAVGRLAGTVAHDFNNILSAIMSYADVLMMELAPHNPLRADVAEIRKASDRAVVLTRQLLTFSRQQVLQPEIFDMNEVIAGVKKMLHSLLGEGVELVLRLSPAIGTVLVDRGSMEQMIVNLAVNARDAMKDGGTLTIETANVVLDDGYVRQHLGAKAGRHVLVTFSDTGVGMDEVTKGRVFEPFFTTKEAGKGTGLGLSTVFGIVQQSGGRIELESEPKKGTRFFVYLPVATGEVTRSRVPADAPTTLRGSETILLVEDDEQLRAIAKASLERCGYTVLAAKDGLDAIASSEAHAGTIDLLLTDVMMPYLRGGQLAEQISAARPAIKILFMSGYTDEAFRRDELLPGGAFLPKPITPSSLTEKVRNVLDGK